MLNTFEPLIDVYVCLLTTGRSFDGNGVTPWYIRTFLKLVNIQWLPQTLARYSTDDIRQEVCLCVLEVAKHKAHMVKALPYAIKAMVRQLTTDSFVRTTDLVRGDEYGGVFDAPVYDDTSALDLLAHVELNARDRMLVEGRVEGLPNAQLAEMYNKRYGKRETENSISRRISRALAEVRRQLGPDVL